MPRTLPAAVEQPIGTLLDLLDRHLDPRNPVQGLYLTGSVALGDFHPAHSDIDFVAVTTRPLTGAALDVLDHIHAALRGNLAHPGCDGLYVTVDDLAGPPAKAAGRPYHLNGTFHPGDDCFDANPVTWQVLRDHAVAVRGPARDRLAVCADPRLLATWTLANLNGYWAGWVDRHTADLAVTPHAGQIDGQTAAWGALGVARLHYTLATGKITSKDGAGAYAMTAFPTRWHPTIAACRAARRRTAPTRFPLAAFQEVLAFMRVVIDDASRLPRTQGY